MERQIKFLISRSSGKTRNATASGTIKPYHSTGFKSGAKLDNLSELGNRQNKSEIKPLVKSNSTNKKTEACILQEKDDLRQRLNFFTQTMNNSGLVLTPTQSRNPVTNLWAITPESKLQKELLSSASKHRIKSASSRNLPKQQFPSRTEVNMQSQTQIQN